MARAGGLVVIPSRARKAATGTGIASVMAIALIVLRASRRAWPMKKIAATAVAGSVGFATALSGVSQAQSPQQPAKNIVLVHGAFADGSSWAKVIPILDWRGRCQRDPSHYCYAIPSAERVPCVSAPTKTIAGSQGDKT